MVQASEPFSGDADFEAHMSSEIHLEPVLVPIPVAAHFLGHHASTIYRLLGDGKIEAVKAGKRTLLKVASLKQYVANLPPAKKLQPLPDEVYEGLQRWRDNARHRRRSKARAHRKVPRRA